MSTDVVKLKRKVERLEALQEVSLELTREKDLQPLLDLIMERITSILGADRSSLFLVEQRGEDEVSGEGASEGSPGTDDEKKRALVSRVAQGVEEIRIPLDDRSIAGHAALYGEVVNIADAYRDDRFNPAYDREHGYKTRSVLAAPMRTPVGRIVGVTEALNKREGETAVFDEQDEEILLAFSGVAAIAVENARWLERQRQTFETLIQGQAVAIDARDHITSGHTWRVAAYAAEIGREMGLADDEVEVLRYAGLLHDQGKLGVPDGILMKPGRLSNWEFELMRSHAEKTKTILEAIRPLFPQRLRKVCEMAPAHHEKLDGSGYPDGLKGAEISLGARILAVADIFDAMTAHRPYREPAPDDEVCDMLEDLARSGKLDERPVAALRKCLRRVTQVRDVINQQIANRTSELSLISTMVSSDDIELSSESTS
jgi:HD-GYP domain-containing protein (c-di-GMP phosphodiesterase class II)